MVFTELELNHFRLHALYIYIYIYISTYTHTYCVASKNGKGSQLAGISSCQRVSQSEFLTWARDSCERDVRVVQDK